MKKIVAFDFDGTLTSKDSLLAFIRFVFGDMKCGWGFLLFSPLIVLMMLRLYSHHRTKERLFGYFFKGMSLSTFNDWCQQFAKANRAILRPQGIATVEQAQQEGAEVVIISASIDNWVQPFFPQVKVLGTQVEVVDGQLTGRFLTANCFGQEKVNRLLAEFPHREKYHLTAYGDSEGDKELLTFADEQHFKPFRP